VSRVRLSGDVSGAENVTKDAVISHSLFISSFCLEMSMKIENPPAVANDQIFECQKCSPG
jgi:hypothetical protein